eukprot:5421607-Alexandrium_andersonii.AAC.1
MSASLVGSEMCIRDRSCCEDPEDWGEPAFVTYLKGRCGRTACQACPVAASERAEPTFSSSSRAT